MDFSSKRKIGVHIRRGDYIFEKNKDVHCLIDPNYYFKAMQFFKSDNVEFILFSDDHKSIKNEFDLSILKI